MNQAGADGGQSGRRLGERLKETLAALDEAHPTGSHVRPHQLRRHRRREVDRAGRLGSRKQVGAKGLKFHKTLSLGYRYKSGKIMPVDDRSWPIRLCGKFNRPVMIHTADPAAFFAAGQEQRAVARAERAPQLAVLRRAVPKREDLLAQFVHVIEQHKTTFIGPIL
jgi:hypothetical protein